MISKNVKTIQNQIDDIDNQVDRIMMVVNDVQPGTIALMRIAIDKLNDERSALIEKLIEAMG